MSNNIQCSKCKEYKHKNKFRKRENSTTGRQYWCRSCENEASRERYKLKRRRKRTKNKPVRDTSLKRKKRMLKSRYDLSYEEYVSMYKTQNECCAICEEQYDLGGHSGLYVDHCHKTGKVRGLLCPRCNSLIGKFLEDKDILLNSLEYLNISLSEHNELMNK